MIALALLAAVATPQAAASATQDPIDPERLVAAHRLWVATGSAATLDARVRTAARLIVLQEARDCLAAAKTNAALDCAAVGTRELDDLTRLPTALPTLIAEMQQVEGRAYARRFTTTDMAAMTQFFASPLYQRFRTGGDEVKREVTADLRTRLRATLDVLPKAPATAPKE